MMEKAAADKRIIGAETLRLYIMILMLQNKHKEVFQLLQDDLDKKFRDESPLLPLGVERGRLIIECHTELKEWAEVAEKYKAMIKTDTEEFLNYKGYFDAVESLIKTAEDGEGGDAAAQLPACKAFIDDVLATSGDSGGKVSIRGPQLARLELAARQPALGGGAVDASQVSELLLGFTKELGSKTSCFHDIKPYLSKLGGAAGGFLAALEAQVTDIAEGAGEPEFKRIRRHILLVEVSRYLREESSTEERLKAVAALLVRYEAALPCGKDLKETEIQHADPYAMISAHCLLDIYTSTKDARYVRRAIIVLERVLLNSCHNNQARLLLVKLYALLGAGECAWNHWQACDVKQVQLDTIGYIVTDHCALVCAPGYQEHICSQTNAFFKHANKEMFEYINNAYKDGSFGKIQEFQEFQDKLKMSTTSAIMHAESEHYLLLAQGKDWYVPNTMEGIVAEEDLGKLSDNRDFDVMDSWENLEGEGVYDAITAHQKASRAAWLRFRTLELHAFQAYHDVNVPLVEEVLPKIAAAYAAGVAAVKPEDGCYMHGFHLPRQNMFAAYRKVYGADDKPVLVSALASSAEVLKVQASPVRGSELEERVAAIRVGFDACTARLEAMRAACASEVGDTFKMRKQLTVDQLEFAHVVIEASRPKGWARARCKLLRWPGVAWHGPPPPSPLPSPAARISGARPTICAGACLRSWLGLLVH